MKQWGLFAVLSACSGIFAAAAPVTLENDRIRVTFEPKAHGALSSFKDLRTGTGFIVTNSSSLYALSFSDGTQTLTTADAENTTIRCENGEVTVTSPRHGGLNVSVTCRFRLDAKTSMLHGRVAVSNGLDKALRSVRFPIIDQPRDLGSDPSLDCLLLPNCDGMLIRNPMASDRLPTLTYPGNASLQCFARYNERSGLFVAALDSSGQTKSFEFEQRDRTLRTAVTHVLSLLRQGEWESGYDVVLGAFHGDWQTAADMYKSWAVKQTWCAKTFFQRVSEGDIPRWMTQPSLFYSWSLRGQLDPITLGNRLPQTVAQAEAWDALLDAPATMMLMAWEKHGPWVTPDYFPPFGGEAAFKSATAALHEAGHHTLVFLSGLNWTLVKDGACDAGHFDDAAAFEARGATAAICGTNGLPQHFKHHPDMGENATLCPVTPQAHDMLMTAALKCQSMGIDCVQADQIVGGGIAPCYSDKHGHPQGGGTWSARAIYKLFNDIRREGKRRHSDFAWSIEEPGEFFIPVLDTYHARDYAQGRWPRSGKMTEGVPLFTHVYHAYLPGYGGDSCSVSTNRQATALYQQAMNLICGKAPGVAVWTRTYDPSRTDEAQARLLRHHVRLWKTSPQYLVFGERIASPPLAVPSVTNRFWIAANRPARELVMPAVLHSAWRASDNTTATVYVCIANGPVTFTASGKSALLQSGEALMIEDKK